MLLALVLAACSGSTSDASRTTTAARAPRATTTTTLPAPADPAAPATIIDPSIDSPNPFVLVEGGQYLHYASQVAVGRENIQVRVGRALSALGPVRDAMPEPPRWVVPGSTWAPDVRHVGTRYVMWFTAATEPGRVDGGARTQCIGWAVSRSPLGPFTGGATTPSICQRDRWGSIDPRTFRDDDGKLWLQWKSDDNAQVGADSHSSIYSQRLAADGATLTGHPVRILEADQPWEGRIVEAPQMVEVGGRHWLFYSGNWFNQPAYAIGVAECDGPTGPCRKPSDHPWLASNAQGEGPGEGSLFHDAGGWWTVYGPDRVGFNVQTVRPTALARVAFGPGGPYLARA